MNWPSDRSSISGQGDRVCHNTLWPFSKVYYNWRVAEGIYEPGKDFHSIRKDFYQSLKSAKVDYAARVVLMGTR